MPLKNHCYAHPAQNIVLTSLWDDGGFGLAKHIRPLNLLWRVTACVLLWGTKELMNDLEKSMSTRRWNKGILRALRIHSFASSLSALMNDLHSVQSNGRIPCLLTCSILTHWWREPLLHTTHLPWTPSQTVIKYFWHFIVVICLVYFK